ncbi:RING finger and WD repeat domain-containing protein 3 [Dimargaris cristalligena]|nr:RING finger and WD repeat domain-containing protein 3 [Dimargaris cristalligena]
MEVLSSPATPTEAESPDSDQSGPADFVILTSSPPTSPELPHWTSVSPPATPALNSASTPRLIRTTTTNSAATPTITSTRRLLHSPSGSLLLRSPSAPATTNRPRPAPGNGALFPFAQPDPSPRDTAIDENSGGPSVPIVSDYFRSSAALGVAPPSPRQQSQDDDFQIIIKRPRLLPPAHPTSDGQGSSSTDSAGPSTSLGDNGGRSEADADDDLTATPCIICFDPMTTAGRHRIVSLRCGHLFGRGCILQWLNPRIRPKCPGTQQRSCPQCKQPANAKHIHPIFAKRVVPADTSELEAMQAKIHEANQRCIRAESELEQVQLARDFQKSQVSDLMVRLEFLQRQNNILKSALASRPSLGPGPSITPGERLGQSPTNGEILDLTGAVLDFVGSPVISPSLKASLTETIMISRQKNACRIIAYNSFDQSLLISTQAQQLALTSISSTTSTVPTRIPSTGSSLPFGVVRISLRNTSHHEYLGIHHKAIRDIAVCPYDGQRILTTGLDRTAVVYSLATRTVVQSYPLEAPGWSCMWHPRCPHYFLVGLANGSVVLVDMRRTTPAETQVRILEPPASRTPIHSLTTITGTSDTAGDPPLLVAGGSDWVFLVPLATDSDGNHSGGPPPNSPAFQPNLIRTPMGFSAYCAVYDPESARLLISYRNPPRKRLVHHVYQPLANPSLPDSDPPTVLPEHDTPGWKLSFVIELSSAQIALARTTLAFTSPAITTTTTIIIIIINIINTTVTIITISTSGTLFTPITLGFNP